jgi:hypothetical protein
LFWFRCGTVYHSPAGADTDVVTASGVDMVLNVGVGAGFAFGFAFG